MRADVLEWLLEEKDPSVRYTALKSLMGLPEGSKEMMEAKIAIMQSGPVAKMLSFQEPEGHWGDPDRFYNDKYTGSCWNLLLLAELGAASADERVSMACEFVIRRSQDPESGGFSYSTSAKTGRGLPSGVIPCLTGNMTYSLIKLGMIDDPRVGSAIDWITRHQRSDDGETKAPKGPPYDRYEMCWGRHICHMGAAKALKALAAIPTEKRMQKVSEKISELAEYFLKHRIYRKSHDIATISKPGWLKLGFPLMYQTDILELCGLFASLGIRDERLDDAAGIIEHKVHEDGRWHLENSFNGKTLVPIEKKGAPSKWITLRALDVIGKYRA